MRLACLSACLVLLVTALPVRAQEDASALERRVKAAFLYKFADYVDWPEGAVARPGAPVTIGVGGDDAVAGELALVAASRPADGRPVIVRKLREGDSLNGLNMLFVGRADAARLLQLARAAPSQPMLVVTEQDTGLNQGGIINFVMSGGRVRFEIAVDNAEKRGLRLSSRLLTVAQSVRTGSP